MIIVIMILIILIIVSRVRKHAIPPPKIPRYDYTYLSSRTPSLEVVQGLRRHRLDSLHVRFASTVPASRLPG